MTEKARLFIALTILSGACLIAYCLWGEPNFTHVSSYYPCLVLALFASTRKVHLPGITGTMSVNFLFVLFSIAVFSFSETVLLASAACVVQCCWRARQRPKPVQVAFNVAALAISAGSSYRVAHLFAASRESYLPVMLAMAGACYFTADTLLVSGVLSLVQHKPLIPLWQQCYLWSFPYYLAGGAISALAVTTYWNFGWLMSLLILPLMYLLYVFYWICVERHVKTTAG